MNVNVYDSVNKSRHLGVLTSTAKFPAPKKLKGHSIRMACMERVPLCAYGPDDFLSMPVIRDIEFRYAGYETVDGSEGWLQQMYFTTDTPLDRLMTLKEFRLPGESERNHDIRTRYCH
ncbi:hypothetical protein CPT_Pasto_027 [Rhizobium phage Pasto]|uniref:Uncharacterized protein n=1 Tax=Rhizobium phage Pasto TaxID=2767575 RepID=A0A7S6R6X4_9CAUD|nr:hypothetical protein CPT_Pasto_027 [Rhizobium phage Pasto]